MTLWYFVALRDKTIVYASVTIVGEIVACKLAYTYIQNFKNQYDKLLFY